MGRRRISANLTLEFGHDAESTAGGAGTRVREEGRGPAWVSRWAEGRHPFSPAAPGPTPVRLPVWVMGPPPSGTRNAAGFPADLR
jgi:hypothetical protein